MNIALLGAYGSAGVAAAKKLSNKLDSDSDKLYLLDGGEPGGLCILDGCMPSKAVLSSAKHAHEAETDPRVNAEKVTIDNEKTIEHKNKYIQSFAEHRRDGVRSIGRQDGVELIESNAHFLTEDRLELEDGREIEVDYTILATGSDLNVPDLKGLADVNYMSSSDILDAKSLPESVVVMGFGAIGMEMSAYLASSGVDVTVIEHDEAPIDNGSDEFGEELVDIYREEFDIEIRTEVYEESIKNTDESVKLSLDDGSTIEAERLCLFTGRVPNVDGLKLDNIGVSPRDDWYNSDLKVKNTSSVYVAGDTTGDRMLLHIAKEQGQLVADNIIAEHNDEETKSYSSPQHVVYFSGNAKYPFSRYGVTGDEGEKREDLITVRRRASEDGIFNLKEAGHGLATMVVEENTGVIKGYEGLHLHSDVMLKTMQVLIESGADVREVPSRAYHPTTPELLDGLFREASERLES